MFSRHLIAAAAMAAATFSAHADVISASPATLSSSVIANATVTGSASQASNMSVVDSTLLSGASDLASILSTSTATTRMFLMRGVEGLYMLGAVQTDAAQTDTAADVVAVIPADVITGAAPAADAGAPAGATPADAALPLADAVGDLPVVNAVDLPEPSSIALLMAGVLGAVAFTRARKQG